MSEMPDNNQRNVDLEVKMQLLDSITKGQDPIWNDPNRGLVNSLGSDLWTKKIEESYQTNTPLSQMMDESYYRIDLLKVSFNRLYQEVENLSILPNISTQEIFEKTIKVLPEVINGALKRENDTLFTLSEAVNVSPLELAWIGDALIQPSMISLASIYPEETLDMWGLTYCPVCGHMPSLALKHESEAWRFKCSFCFAEYKMDIFTCPRCGDKEIDSKELLLVGKDQALEISVCKTCNHYYKVINEVKLKSGIPQGLEEYYTNILDEVAAERGYKRIDEIEPEE
jgi:formate dehydrogenase maturation protein FdhE